MENSIESEIVADLTEPDLIDIENYGQTVADLQGDGYTLVDTVTYGTESKRIALTDLKPQVKVEYDERAQFGVSAAFTSVTTHSGYVDLRIIADHNSRAALSRKDADGVTYLKVHFRHQDA